MLTLVIFVGLLLDYWLGEPARFHPIVGFGKIANWLELRLNSINQKIYLARLLGMLAWIIAVLPIVYIGYLLSEYCWQQHFVLGMLFDSLCVYFAVALTSLKQHALNVYQPLSIQHMGEARLAVSMLVSRETSELDEPAICRATIESTLENGHDAVIASLFWYCVGGIPLLLIHRLANTLDAMWGYKNTQFIHFGWFAARIDDCLGWPSAKISGLLYIVSSPTNIANKRRALLNAFQQSRVYKSLNGGWVMAAGASVLNLQLGGSASYHGTKIDSPILGVGQKPARDDILRAIQLLQSSCWFFVSLIGISQLLVWLISSLVNFKC